MVQFSGEQHHGVALENFNESRMSRAGPDLPGHAAWVCRRPRARSDAPYRRTPNGARNLIARHFLGQRAKSCEKITIHQIDELRLVFRVDVES
jgi:hypothetical protein